MKARRRNTEEWFRENLPSEESENSQHGNGSEEDIYFFYPETRECCGVHMELIMVSNQVQLFTGAMISTQRHISCRTACEHCQSVYYFDGRARGLVNFNNCYIFDVGKLKQFTAALFNEMLELKLNSGTPTHSWWKAKVDCQLAEMDSNDPRKSALRQLWMGLTGRLTTFMSEYLKLVDYPMDLFKCCEVPEIISTDGGYRFLTVGIVLSIETWRIEEANLQAPWKSKEPPLSQRASTRTSRSVIPFKNNEDRKQMYEYSHSDGIQEMDYKKLIRVVKALCLSIGSLLESTSVFVNKCFKPHASLKPFFQSCSKLIFPAIHFVPKCLWDEIESLIKSKTLSVEIMESVARQSPILSNTLGFYFASNSTKDRDMVKYY